MGGGPHIRNVDPLSSDRWGTIQKCQSASIKPGWNSTNWHLGNVGMGAEAVGAYLELSNQ